MTASEKDVTVIMPVYNGEAHLAEAVESVLNQTYEDFEFIIINDGSTDNSGRIIEHYSRIDRRILLLAQPHDGHGVAMNRGLDKAQSEWVARMDADDVMLPIRLERQIAFVKENPEIKVASCRAIYIDENGKAFGRTVNQLKSQQDLDHLKQQGEAIGLLQPGVLMHRNSIVEVGGYRGQFFPADDIDLWTRVVERGHLVLIQDEVLMHYRIHSGSAVTSNFIGTRMKYEWVRACMRARRSGRDEPSWDEFMAEWRAMPAWRKANWWRKTWAKAFYRQAGYDFLGGRRLAATARLSAAAALQPGYVVPRLREQLRR